MLESLRKFVAPEFITGVDARKQVGLYANNLGMTRVLVVSDAGVAAAGWAEQAVASLEEAGLETILFMDSTPNPKDYEVDQGVEAYFSGRCDGIVAVGGGSPMDCAKGIGILVNNGGGIKDYEGVDTIASPSPPLICIPTTAGSSADVSQFAIICNTSREVKMAIVSKALVPDVSLIDPLPLTTMDRTLTANTGMDALTHACEALVSNASSEITTLHALEAIRCIKEGLVASCSNGTDIQARASMLLGSLHAGLAFSNASLGAVHAMAHALGGVYDLPHGECNALLLPHVIEFNYPAASTEYAAVCRILAPEVEPNVQNLVAAIKDLMQRVDITKTLRDMGVESSKFKTLAEVAVQDACMATNPIDATVDDIVGVFAHAF